MVVTTEPRMVNKFGAHNPTSFKHMPFSSCIMFEWCVVRYVVMPQAIHDAPISFYLTIQRGEEPHMNANLLSNQRKEEDILEIPSKVLAQD